MNAQSKRHLTLVEPGETDTKDVYGSGMAHHLAESEQAIDALLGQLGRGLTHLAEGRREAGLRAGDGRKGFSRYVGMISQTAELRMALVETHAQLAIDARKAGISWRMGPTESTPDEPVTDGPRGG